MVEGTTIVISLSEDVTEILHLILEDPSTSPLTFFWDCFVAVAVTFLQDKAVGLRDG